MSKPSEYPVRRVLYIEDVQCRPFAEVFEGIETRAMQAGVLLSSVTVTVPLDLAQRMLQYGKAWGMWVSPLSVSKPGKVGVLARLASGDIEVTPLPDPDVLDATFAEVFVNGELAERLQLRSDVRPKVAHG